MALRGPRNAKTRKRVPRVPYSVTLIAEFFPNHFLIMQAIPWVLTLMGGCNTSVGSRKLREATELPQIFHRSSVDDFLELWQTGCKYSKDRIHVARRSWLDAQP